MQTNDQSVMMNTLVNDLIKEKRSDRFWRNIRFFIGFCFVVLVFLMIFSRATGPAMSEGEGKDYVSLIRLSGMIGPDEDFSSQTVVPLLEEAFSDSDAKGVLLFWRGYTRPGFHYS